MGKVNGFCRRRSSQLRSALNEAGSFVYGKTMKRAAVRAKFDYSAREDRR